MCGWTALGACSANQWTSAVSSASTAASSQSTSFVCIALSWEHFSGKVTPAFWSFATLLMLTSMAPFVISALSFLTALVPDLPFDFPDPTALRSVETRAFTQDLVNSRHGVTTDANSPLKAQKRASFSSIAKSSRGTFPRGGSVKF